ncbi:MAG TPA: adenylyltransferase/cytidyltransferase family protein [Nitrolancea sp.]|nr:adenylyltransferase/cytidyltransferase family protein [Nitrolancea sp.]
MGQRVEFAELERLGQDLRRDGKRVVFTNGHFDLLHVGHLRYLQAARALGDCLVVGINDDQTTTARKGPHRPIVPEDERAELVAGLACVDYVVIFPQPTAEEAIRALRPALYVKGGDYGITPEEIAGGKLPLPEAAVVAEYGGDVRTIPLIDGQSTTGIERRIVERICQARD